MKHFIKKFALLSYFCLATFLYYSCTQEKEYINGQNRINFDLKEKSLKEALNMPIFSNAYSKLTKKKFSSTTSETARTALEDQFGFTIVPDVPVKIISKPDGTVFFTLLIEREVKEELKFENLMIQIKNNETSAAIFKYTMEEKAIKTITNEIIIKEIPNSQFTDLNIDGKMFFNSDGDTCFDINVIQCSVPDHRPAGHIATSECWSYFNNVAGASNIYYATSVVCMNDGGIGGGGETGGTGGTSSSTNNTGGLGASGGSSDPVVISPTPCHTANCIEVDTNTKLPCDLLNKLKNDNDFKSRMNGLKNNVDGGNLFETVIVLENKTNPTATNNYTYTNFQGNATNPSPSYECFTTSDGVIHNHYESLLSIFTMVDLADLYDKMKVTSISDDFFIGLVTKRDGAYGIYIINIENRAKFIEFGDKYLRSDTSSYKDFGNDKFMKKYGIKDNGSLIGNERGFNEMMKDYNIGLNIFKGDTTFQNWRKMKYNSSTMDTELDPPCN